MRTRLNLSEPYIPVMTISFDYFTTLLFLAKCCSRRKKSAGLEHTLIGGLSGHTRKNSMEGTKIKNSTFTLLFQDVNGGLEFQNRQTGTFVPAVPIDGILYMNIGDMFERISNGKGTT